MNRLAPSHTGGDSSVAQALDSEAAQQVFTSLADSFSAGANLSANQQAECGGGDISISADTEPNQDSIAALGQALDQGLADLKTWGTNEAGPLVDATGADSPTPDESTFIQRLRLGISRGSNQVLATLGAAGQNLKEKFGAVRTGASEANTPADGVAKQPVKQVHIKPNSQAVLDIIQTTRDPDTDTELFFDAFTNSSARSNSAFKHRFNRQSQSVGAGSVSRLPWYRNPVQSLFVLVVALIATAGLVWGIYALVSPLRSISFSDDPSILVNNPAGEQPGEPPVLAGLSIVSNNVDQHSDDVSKINGGDKTDPWRSLYYDDSNFEQMGFDPIGVAVNLEKPARVSKIRLYTPCEGGLVELRNTTADDPTGGEVLASASFAKDSFELVLEKPVELQNLVLLIRELPRDDQDFWRAKISVIEVE